MGTDILELGMFSVALVILLVTKSSRQAKNAFFLVLIGLSEGHFWLNDLEASIDLRLFQVFLVSLIGLMLYHEHKLRVIVLGCGTMLVLFLIHHGAAGLIEHFFAEERHAEDRRHIIGNLALLLPGFSLVSYFFERSGACSWIERRVQTDRGLLCMVFGLSIVLDNIAAAMIGGSIVMARYALVIHFCRAYDKRFPEWLYLLLIGVIAASNLGGAASAVGDTTTVMIYLSTGVGVLGLMKGFIGSIPAQILMAKLMTRKHKEMPEDYDHTQAGRQEYVHWTWFGDFIPGLITAVLLLVLPWRWGRLCRLLLAARNLYPLLAIPGMVLGNVLYDEAGIGLWMGLYAGLVLTFLVSAIFGVLQTDGMQTLLGVPGFILGLYYGQPGVGLACGVFLGMMLGKLCERHKSAQRTHGDDVHAGWKELSKSMAGTAFLLLLVIAAKLLPLGMLIPQLRSLGADELALLLGLLSAVFDNIPLTSMAIDMGGFHWPFLALTVGFGGSLLWFGSSAGVALAKQFPELQNTRRWVPKPIFYLLIVYLVMSAVHLITWRMLVPAVWG